MATRESSVLFSLNELRTLEQQRIRDEAEVECRRQEAERRAREAEARRARDAEEALRRAADEAERQAAREREQLAADERVRVREAELRAQAEQQARLEQVRLDAEARAVLDVRGRFPYGRVIGGTLLSVGMVVVALMLFMQKRDAEVVKESRAMTARLDAEQRELERRQAAERDRFEAQLRDVRDRLKHARDESDAAALRKQIDEKRHLSRPRPSRGNPAPATTSSPLKVNPGALLDPIGDLKVD